VLSFAIPKFRKFLGDGRRRRSARAAPLRCVA
jgi:hypothetical protein